MEAHWKPYLFNRKNSHYVFVCLGQLFADPSMGFITLKNHRLVWGICVCFFPQWTHLIHPKTIKRYKHIPWIPFKCLCFCWWRQVFSQCFFFSNRGVPDFAGTKESQGIHEDVLFVQVMFVGSLFLPCDEIICHSTKAHGAAAWQSQEKKSKGSKTTQVCTVQYRNPILSFFYSKNPPLSKSKKLYSIKGDSRDSQKWDPFVVSFPYIQYYSMGNLP